MPLRSGKSDKVRNQNIHTLMGEVGKSPHVQSRAQAIAIAYAKQRQGKRKQDGGPAEDDSSSGDDYAPSSLPGGYASASQLTPPEHAPDTGPQAPPASHFARQPPDITYEDQAPPTGRVTPLRELRGQPYLSDEERFWGDRYGPGPPGYSPEEMAKTETTINPPPGPFIMRHGLFQGTDRRPEGGVGPPLGRGMLPEYLPHLQNPPSVPEVRHEWGQGKRPGTEPPQQTHPPTSPPMTRQPLDVDPFGSLSPPPTDTGAARGGAIEHAIRIAQQSGGSLPLMGSPGDTVEPAFKGPIYSHVPGRIDKHELDVKPGSYVWPADSVSAIGQGNSLAGGHLIRFSMTPKLEGDIKLPQAGHSLLPGMQPHPKMHPPLHLHPAKIPGMKKSAESGRAEGGRAEGGRAEDGSDEARDKGLVPIIAAGGEVVTPPEHIIWKYGSLDHGHKVMDALVKRIRAKEAERLKKAPPPRK